MEEIIDKSESLFSIVRNQPFDRIILTGSGTSFHSAQQAQRYMRSILPVEVTALYPFMVEESIFDSFKGKTLLVGISQGGASYSTYNAMKLAREKGASTASMAGVDPAYVDKAADYVLTVHCGEERAGAKTKGYYCTKLNLMLFAMHMARAQGYIDGAGFDKDISQIEDARSRFMTVYHQAEDWIGRNRERLLSAGEIRVIGASELYGDVLECALKLLETMRVPVTGYEFEEFIHGIYNAVNENSTVFILDSGAEERSGKLVSVMSEWTEYIYVIGRSSGEGDKNLSADISADKNCQTFNFPIPIQLICAKIPELKGINPSVPKDPQFHRKLGSKNFQDQ
jgi:glucosamine 6-phosphate synthetase-like amidotransferase/phosphosugar isomerase protein